jgi:hypothetical protein
MQDANAFNMGKTSLLVSHLLLSNGTAPVELLNPAHNATCCHTHRRLHR